MSSQSLCFLFVGYLEGGGAQYLHAMAEELQKRGHRVELLAIDNPNPNPIYGVLRCTPWQFGWVGRSILERQLFSTIRRVGVDVVLVYSPNRFVRASTLAKLRKRGVATVLWEDDLALREGFQVEAAAEFDLIVATDSYIVPFLKNVLGHRHVHMLQGCALPEAYPAQNLTAEQQAEFGAEVSFIGKFFPHRERFFQSLARPVRIWGPDWREESALPDRADIVTLDPKDKPLVYAASKINLHLRAGHQQVNGFSSRIYEVPLCGGFILAEATRDLEDCFAVDHEIAVFRTAEEARDKIEYFLANEHERIQMTERLRQRVLRDYTLKGTVARFEEVLAPVVNARTR